MTESIPALTKIAPFSAGF